MQEIELLVSTENGSIVTNIEVIKKHIAAGLEEYKHMVFTEETKKEAKATVADLRKLKKEVNARKIEVKKRYMAPYEDFETQAKELMSLIDEPIDYIDGQIKEFEQKRIEERKALITDTYDGIMQEHEDVKEYLPLSRIYNSKWENATTSMKAINEEIMERVEHTEKDLAMIRSMGSEFEDKGIAAYARSVELADAISTMNQYQKQKEEILRRKEEDAKRKAEMEERKAQEVLEKVENHVVADITSAQEVKAASVDNVYPGDTTFNARYEIKADAFQIAQLESAMREYGIEYRRVQ